MNNLDQAKNMPVWCASGIVGGLTLYVWLVFNISFIFRLLQEVRLFMLGILLFIWFNLLAAFMAWSYILTLRTPTFVDSQPDVSEERIEQIKQYTKKSNAITQTQKLKSTRFLFNTSNITQHQLAYAQDINDVFDASQQNYHNNNNQLQHQQQQQQLGNQNISNQPPRDEEQQLDQLVSRNQNISYENHNNIFSQEEYENFDSIADLQAIKYCFKCGTLKPPRAHHCKICNRCILRMDHHCPWVGNCVGERNHKYFIQFLIYTCVASFTVCLSFLIDYAFYNQSIAHGLSDVLQKHYSVICSGCLPVFLSMAGFSIYQLYIGAENYTTIESNVPQLTPQNNPFRKHYKIDNLKEILGEQISLWLLPVEDHIKSTRSFLQTMEE